MTFLLSHYTNIAGLEGIAKTQTIRATRYLTLNDELEYEFAWKQLLDAAQNYALDLLPEDLRGIARNIGLPKVLQNQLLDRSSEIPYGHLYVTSFALSDDKYDETNGNLTLWDRYTRNEGYCLQFHFPEIERIINAESDYRSYLYINASKVTYGIDENSDSFCKIKMQIGLKFLENILMMTRDPRIENLIRKHFYRGFTWPHYVLATKIMGYCGVHKHPAFKDEREFRILAYPSPRLQADMLTGISMPKNIYGPLDGKRYIVLGEDFCPGIQPRSIIVGPKANRGVEHILNHFPERPLLSYSDIPIKVQ